MSIKNLPKVNKKGAYSAKSNTWKGFQNLFILVFLKKVTIYQQSVCKILMDTEDS